jgi:uncharacterized protein
MQIIHLTDIHSAGYLIDEISEPLKKADLIILSGDITHFGKERETISIISKIEKYNTKILAVTGNCDFDEVQDYLNSRNMNLHRETKRVGDLVFAGIAGSLPCPGKTPNEYSETEVSLWLNEFQNNINEPEKLVLVSHQPPFNTINDAVSEDEHVGSTAIRKFIEKTQPLICLTGHIHEGIGIDTIGKTKIVNPGPFRTGKYAVIQISDNSIVDIELKQITA